MSKRQRRERPSEFRQYRGETYYDLPGLKDSPWGWLIAGYFFIGGLAGAAQVIATVTEFAGGKEDRAVVRTGRYLALIGVLISPVLLILDLHTPTRWFNMLRIYRRTSPMSIGSWALAAFGTFTGITALMQMLHDVTGKRAYGSFARRTSIPAALTGATVATYTATLLSATSTPLWLASYRQLPPLFASTAMATASAAIALVLEISRAPRTTRRRLETLGLVASVTQLLAAIALDKQWKKHGVAGPLEEPPTKAVYRFGALGLGIIAPLGIHAVQLLTGRQIAALTIVSALATLTGGFIERAMIVLRGPVSTQRAGDYFHLAQPEQIAELAPADPWIADS